MNDTNHIPTPLQSLQTKLDAIDGVRTALTPWSSNFSRVQGSPDWDLGARRSHSCRAVRLRRHASVRRYGRRGLPPDRRQTGLTLRNVRVARRSNQRLACCSEGADFDQPI